MNKTGKIISVYWFAILFLVAGAVAYMTIIFYGQPKDIRGIEANILTNQIADCLSEGGYLKEGVLKQDFKDNLMQKCNLNFSVEDTRGWKEEEQYYFKVNIHKFDSNAPDSFGEKISEFSEGNINLETLSLLEESKEEKRKLEFIVIHYTAGFSAEGAISSIKNSRLTMHYMIDRDGYVISEDNEDSIVSTGFLGLGRRAFVSENKNAQHSGCYDAREKETRPECSDISPECLNFTGLLKPECKAYADGILEEKKCCIEGFNSKSIGIELVNLGYICNEFLETCKTLGGSFESNGKIWESYPEEQINSLVNLVSDLASRYNIPIDKEHIIGHDEITNFKSDPGPAFPWDEFIERVKSQQRFPPAIGRNFYTTDKDGNQYSIKILSIVRKTEKNVV